MSSNHAHEQHGDVFEKALQDAERHQDAGGKEVDPVPPADNGGHAHSVAAHLGNAHEHTKPQGNLRQGASPGELRQPPQQISRVGKQHRGQ